MPRRHDRRRSRRQVPSMKSSISAADRSDASSSPKIRSTSVATVSEPPQNSCLPGPTEDVHSNRHPREPTERRRVRRQTRSSPSPSAHPRSTPNRRRTDLLKDQSLNVHHRRSRTGPQQQECLSRTPNAPRISRPETSSSRRADLVAASSPSSRWRRATTFPPPSGTPTTPSTTRCTSTSRGRTRSSGSGSSRTRNSRSRADLLSALSASPVSTVLALSRFSGVAAHSAVRSTRLAELGDDRPLHQFAVLTPLCVVLGDPDRPMLPQRGIPLAAIVPTYPPLQRVQV